MIKIQRYINSITIFFSNVLANHPKMELRSNRKFKKEFTNNSRRKRRGRVSGLGAKGSLRILKAPDCLYMDSWKFMGEQASYLEEKYELQPHQAVRIVQSLSFCPHEKSDHLPFIVETACKDSGQRIYVITSKILILGI